MLWYSTLLEQPFCKDYLYFTSTKTVEVRITLLLQRLCVTVPAGATTGTVSVQTTLDTIDEVDETFNIANGTVSTTTILDDDVAPTINATQINTYSEINSLI
jgi:hypothetical protein